jgi:chorismate synthase
VVLRAAMKPIASTLTPQITVDLGNGIQGFTKYERSDFCPVPRAVPVLEAMAAFVISDVLLEKLGGDSLEEMLPRFSALKHSKLSDLPMDNIEHTFWG